MAFDAGDLPEPRPRHGKEPPQPWYERISDWIGRITFLVVFCVLYGSWVNSLLGPVFVQLTR